MSAAPTPAGAWVKDETLHTLPTGNVAKLRSAFPVYMLLRTGQFDDELLAAYYEWVGGQITDPVAASRLVDMILTTMFIEPRVTPDGDDDTLSIDDLDDRDIDYVLKAAAGGVVDPSFRGEQSGADGGENGQVLADKPKPAAGAAKRKPRSPRRRPEADAKARG